MGDLAGEDTPHIFSLATVLREQQSIFRSHALAVKQIKGLVDAVQIYGTANGQVCFKREVSDPAADDDHFPYVSLSVACCGCLTLAFMIFKESRAFSKNSAASNFESFASRQYWKLLAEYLQYRLDSFLSVSPIGKPLFLSVLSFVIIMQSAIALMTLTGEEFHAAMWKGWTYVADSGTHAGSVGTIEKIVGFFTSIAGMIVFAMMIGVITDTIGDRLEDFKKGKSTTFETDHTLILGWSAKGPVIIRQIALANQSVGGRPIVVLCDQSKEEMEEMLESSVNSRIDPLMLYGTRITFRRGNTLAEVDLMKVSATRARAIIVLSPDNLEPDAADSRMVRQVLSLQQLKARNSFRGFAVVEIQDIDNRELVEIAGKGDVEVIATRDMIGRLMLLSSRSPLIAMVLDELVGFEGSEFYIKEWPQLIGQPFGSLRFRFPDAVPVGLKLADGSMLLNPPADHELRAGDRVICLAEDDDSYEPASAGHGDYEGFLLPGELPDRDDDYEILPEKMLFCGWRRDMADLIRALDEDVSHGSELWLFNRVPIERRAAKLLDQGTKMPLRLHNLTMRHVVGNPLIRRDLVSLAEVSDGQVMPAETLDEYSGECDAANEEAPSGPVEAGKPTGRREMLNFFSSISILSDYGEAEELEGELIAQTADNSCIATTLIIRDIQRACVRRMRTLGLSCEYSPTISEIIEPGTRGLMDYTTDLSSQGYVMSSTLVAATLATVAEDRHMNQLFGELLSSRGNQIRIRRAGELVESGRNEPLSFWDVSCLAGMSREILLGYIPAESLLGAGATNDDPPSITLSDAGRISVGSVAPVFGAIEEDEEDDLAQSKSFHRIQIELNPPNKATPRHWNPDDRLILLGYCRQAKRRRRQRDARLRAQEGLLADFARLGLEEVPIHGRLVMLASGGGCGQDADAVADEAAGAVPFGCTWWTEGKDRLCFVRNGQLWLVSETRMGAVLCVCGLDEVRSIRTGSAAAAADTGAADEGLCAFRLELRRSSMGPAGGEPASVFCADTEQECDRWVHTLTDLVAKMRRGGVNHR